MACIECRRRRIKCDDVRPKCCHCSRLSKRCEYALPEQRKATKRNYVKELEDRLASVEAKLSGGGISPPTPEVANSASRSPLDTQSVPIEALSFTIPPTDLNSAIPCGVLPFVQMDWHEDNDVLASPPIPDDPLTMQVNEADQLPDLEEVQELHTIFFEEVFPCIPILHPERHDPSNLSVETEDPLCLRYMMWAHAAQRSTKFSERAFGFYKNARMHLEHDEMQGDGVGVLSIAHVQTCCLVAIYEADLGTPARAFMSNRRAVALSSMVGLHAQDETDSWASFNLLKPAKDWIEAEERRRTFWYLFYSERWANASSRKFSGIKESEEITTLLPVSEAAFRSGLSEKGQTLQNAVEHGLSENTAPLSVAVVAGVLLTRLNNHLRQLQEDLREQKNPGKDFWLRHQQLENDITKILSGLPGNMRHNTTTNPLAFFVNMCLYEYLVTLFRTASAFAQKCSAPDDMTAKLRSRSRQAAEEIINTMRYASFIGVRKMVPSTPSCLYIASRVFVDDLKDNIDVDHTRDKLQFIVHYMRLFRKHWKVTQMFLEQLLINLKDCDINLEIDPADTASMKIFEKFGDDFGAFGPMFATNPALVQSEFTKHT